MTLYAQQLGWIDTANQGIQEILGLPDSPKYAGDDIGRIEMLSRAINKKSSEVMDYLEFWAEELEKSKTVSMEPNEPWQE
jgi:hypothetical protein